MHVYSVFPIQNVKYYHISERGKFLLWSNWIFIVFSKWELWKRVFIKASFVTFSFLTIFYGPDNTRKMCIITFYLFISISLHTKGKHVL